MSKFHVGDEVIITGGTYQCAHGVAEEMIKMIGEVVHIKSSDESSRFGCYKVREDPLDFIWCNNCFEHYAEPPEDRAPVSDEEFNEILDFIFEPGGSGV